MKETYEEWLTAIANTRLLFNTMAELEDWLDNHSLHNNGVKRSFKSVQRMRAVNIAYRISMPFKSGDRITNKELKARMQMIYQDLGLKKTAKASDITSFGFTTRACKINVNGSRLNGVEITKI